MPGLHQGAALILGEANRTDHQGYSRQKGGVEMTIIAHILDLSIIGSIPTWAAIALWVQG